MLALRLITSGLILTAIPLCFMGYEVKAAEDFSVLKLKAEHLNSLDNTPYLTTDLNRINLKTVSGDDKFSVHDKIYVHLFTRGNQTPYPFAVTKDKQAGDKNSVILAAIVIAKTGDQISLKYGYEHYHKSWFQLADNQKTLAIKLGVDGFNISRIIAVNTDGYWLEAPLYELSNRPPRTVGPYEFRS